MATTVPTGGWSASIALVASQAYRLTVTPGTGGRVLVQWSTDGVSWTEFALGPIAATQSLAVPAAAVYLRGIAFDVAGSIATVPLPSRDAEYDALTPVGGTEALDDLAALALLDINATYFDISTGLRYWATSPTEYELVGGAAALSAIAYSGASIASFTSREIDYVVTYPSATEIDIDGSDGSHVDVTLDGSGRVVSIN